MVTMIPRLTKPRPTRREIVFSTFWTAFYILSIGRGVTVLNGDYQSSSLDLINTPLIVLGIGLSIYFWHYDVVSPGIKRIYPSKSILSNALGVLVVLSLFSSFSCVNDPRSFILLIGVVYLAKAAWHHRNRKEIRKMFKHLSHQVSADLTILQCATLTNAVAGAIISLYIIVSVVFEQMKFPSSPALLPWQTAGSLIAIEVHYQAIERLMCPKP